MFKIFNSVLKYLVRIAFNGLTNANRSILTIQTMNTQIKTLYQLQVCGISISHSLTLLNQFALKWYCFIAWPDGPF